MEIVEFINEESQSNDLKEFLTSQTWEFYEEEQITEESFNTKMSKNHFRNDSTKTYLCYENGCLLGCMRYFDLENVDDDFPMFDIKIHESSRGKGVGTFLLNQTLGLIFKEYSNIFRIEATTREDNVAMQKLFEKCGFNIWGKSSKSWKKNSGEFVSTFHYEKFR